MSPTLNAVEMACLKKLAELFEKGELRWNSESGWESIGLTGTNFMPVISTFKKYGYIDGEINVNLLRHIDFSITPSAAQAVRVIAKEEEKGKDIVEHVKVTLRNHPIIGWFTVIFIAITVFATAISQIGAALKVLGLSK